MSENKKENFLNELPIAYSRHRMIFDDLGNPVDYIFLEVNTAFEKFTGLKKEMIVGKKLSVALPEIFEDSFDWISTYGEVVKEKTNLELKEFSEGLDKWYNIYAYAVGEEDFATIFFDISDSVKKSEEQLATYIMLNDIIIELDDDYIVTNMVAPNEAFLFAPIEETIGTNLVDSLPGDHPRILLEVLERAKESGRLETTFYSSEFNGKKRWFQADVKYVEINKKKKYITSVRDITEVRILEKKLSDREQLFSTVFEQAPVGIVIIRGYEGLVNVNPEFIRIVGRTKEELKKMHWSETIHPEDFDIAMENFLKFKNKEIQNYSMMLRFVRKDGTFVWVNMMVDHIKIDTDISDVETHLCIVRDVSDTIEAELALKESERSKAVLLAHLPGIAYRCKFDNKWTMEFISEGCYELTGYKPEQFINNNEISFENIINPEYRDYLWGKWNSNLQVGKILREEYQITTASGENKWVFEQGQGVYDEDGKVVALEGLIIDITESKNRELKIVYMNDHDNLTDLYNRRYFFEAIKKYDETGRLPLSIILGNLNGIRLINNAFGNEYGDELIKATAKIMTESCGENAVVARIGGDDFGILLPDADSVMCHEIIEKIKKSCEEYENKKGRYLKSINITIGSGTKKDKYENILDVYTLSQDNMYKSKLLDRKSSHGDILSAIMAALFAKSQETENHAKRLADISKQIGIRMDLPSNALVLLELLSMLHDIGKMGINDQVLNKPGKLTDEEWSLMKKHPEIGYKIAISSPELEPIAEYILTHHEHWDGKGYPAGISGEEIPLLSRIVAVADAYDAMTEKRIYRKSITPSEAAEEINRCSGTQFDPGVVKVFNELANEKLI